MRVESLNNKKNYDKFLNELYINGLLSFSPKFILERPNYVSRAPQIYFTSAPKLDCPITY